MKYSQEFLRALRAKRFATGGTVPRAIPVRDPNAPPPRSSSGAILPPHPGHGIATQASAPTSKDGISGSQTFSQPNQLGFQARVPTSNLTFNQGLYGNSTVRGQNTINALTDRLTAEANGQGPSLAQSQLTQATDQNAASAAGAIASQRGLNPALAARLIAQNQAAVTQQAAGQSAVLRSQEQLAAQNQLGQLGLGQFGTAGRLLSDNDKMGLEQAQGNQNAALHAQDTNANISLANQGVAQHNLDTEVKAGAGILNGVGTALGTVAQGAKAAGTQTQASNTGAQTSPTDTTTTDEQPEPGYVSPQPNSPVDNGGTYTYDPPTYAHGGFVRALAARYAQGGPVPSYDYSGASEVQDPKAVNLLGNGTSTPATAPTATASSGQSMDSAHADMTGTNGGEKTWDTAASAVPIFGAGLVAVKNAVQDARYQHEKSLTPEQLKQEQIDNNGPINIAGWVPYHYGDDGSWVANARGGKIPGKAAVKGDSYANDTVPAVLSPGEIVLPRSVTQAEDAPSKAKAFVQAIKNSKKNSAPAGPSGGYGAVLTKQRELAARLARLEAMAKGGR